MDHNVINVRQSKILSNIMAYLGTNHRDDTFIKQFEPGYCQGIATLWLYSKWLETQPNPNQKNRDDYKWFQSTIMLIADWDQKRKLTQKEEFEFERFISLIEIFQHPEHYLPSRPHSLEQYFEDTISGREKDLKSLKEMEEILTQQLNEPNLLKEKKTLLETKLRDLKTAIKVREGIQKQEEEKKYNPDENRQLKKEYAIGALFTLDQLKQLLKTDNLIQDGKLILIISHNHATALLRNGNNYIFFDPNYETGEITVGSPDKVAELIFNANGFENNKPSPLGFMMFSFTDIPTKKYPSPKMVLDSINPLSTIPETGYGHARSPLMVAAIIGSAETAIYFLEKGVNPVLQDKDGWTAATIAAEKGHANIIESLHKINPNLLREPNKNGWTAATIAAENGHANIIELLHKINPNLLMEPDKNGWTAATMAAVNGQANIIELLHKINPNLLMEPDKNGWTAATTAAEKGHANVIELLYKINPNFLSEPNRNGNTVATIAAANGQANIIEFLNKINPILLREPDKNGWPPATMAAANGRANVITVLINNKIINADNPVDEATVLEIFHYAVKKNHLDVAKLLFVLAKKAFASQKKMSVFLALAAIVFSVIIMLYPPNILVPLIPIIVSAITVMFIIATCISWFRNANNINKIEVEIGIAKKNEINKVEEKNNALEKKIKPAEVEEKIYTSTTMPKKESTDIPVIPKVVLTTPKQPVNAPIPDGNKKIEKLS